MATSAELDELVQCVRRVLPAQRQFTRLEQNLPAGIVEVTWHSRNFAVTPRLEVVELKGRTLVCTGASMLLQTALRTKERNNRMLSALIETLRMAEDSMRFNPERGFALLEDVKDTLLKSSGGARVSKPKESEAVAAS
ncbi:MAG: hypothetical protein FJ398_07615 [Verrucomicrobia bacterium]|nr:hypothetical protein [Verrucomicrobiota bacterium]